MSAGKCPFSFFDATEWFRRKIVDAQKPREISSNDLFKGPTASTGHPIWSPAYEATSSDPMDQFHTLDPICDPPFCQNATPIRLLINDVPQYNFPLPNKYALLVHSCKKKSTSTKVLKSWVFTPC